MNNEQGKQKLDDSIRLDIDECEFPALYKLNLVKATQLCKELNAIFYSVFSDYDGMTITMDQAVGKGSLYINLWFLPGSRHKIATEACVPATQLINTVDRNANLVERQIAQSRASKNAKLYRLTDQARRFLARYICDFKINHTNQPKSLVDRINWNDIEQDQVETTQKHYWERQNSTTYCSVRFISIEKLLSQIYGSKSESGRPIQYQVSVAVQLPSTVAGVNNDKLLSVASIDVNMMEQVTDKLGFSPAISNFGIIR